MPTFIAAQELEVAEATVVDRAALNFPKGTYGTCINGQTFQHNALTSYKGYQYAVYYASGGRLAIARRKLSGGAWQQAYLDYIITHNNTHNCAAIGICTDDGTIHMAFDHHNDPLHYCKSVPDLVNKPEDFAWNSALFSEVITELEPGKPLKGITYPMFVNAPHGKLQLIYRIGQSGSGDWYMADYDSQEHTWTTLGMLFSREGKYENSTSRCAYPNPLRYGPNGRLHATWCWRERPKNGPRDLRTNHDLCYAYSDDNGLTWKSNEGTVVAKLGNRARQAITVESNGVVVSNTTFLWGQMNTTTEWVDAKGRVHVVNWQNPSDAKSATTNFNEWRYEHYWRSSDGLWRNHRLPFYGRKPQIVLDSNNNAYVIYTEGDNLNYHGQDDGGRLTIRMASEKGDWRDWKLLWQSKNIFVGEPLIDEVLWRESQVLSIYAQEKPITAGSPSPLKVLNFKPASN